jgi:hypothetical protein
MLNCRGMNLNRPQTAKTTHLVCDVVKAGVVRHELVLVAYEAVVDAVCEIAVDAVVKVVVEAVVEAVVETAVVEAVVGLLAVDLVNSAHAACAASQYFVLFSEILNQNKFHFLNLSKDDASLKNGSDKYPRKGNPICFLLGY